MEYGGEAPWRMVGRPAGAWSRLLGVGGWMEVVLRHLLKDMLTEVVGEAGSCPNP